MPEIAISADKISKRYRIGFRPRGRYRTLRETLVEIATNPFRRPARSEDGKGSASEIIWALKDISFEVKRGEVLGLIGRNGAGKSTLLKVLSRITEPSSGVAEIRGRVGSLLEVGTGFHQELTGRENIYLNGAILGMSRSEIERKFDEIVAFAEVEKFIDTPVKRYSSGMYLRLAFAVAAHLETEILLVDEVLAVGDAAFRRKCLGKMQEVGSDGRTVIFVSHDMTSIAGLAQKSVYLEQGQLKYIGPTDDAIRLYVSQPMTQNGDLRNRRDRSGDGVIRMESINIYNAEGAPVQSIQSGDEITISIEYNSKLQQLDTDALILDLRVTDVLGHPIVTFSTRFSPMWPSVNLPGSGTLNCHIPTVSLADETYFFDLITTYRGAKSDAVPRAAEILVTTSDYFGTGFAPVKHKHGAALLKHEWSFSHR